jgi:hypothetical protein
LAVMALLLGLSVIPARSQGQPPKLEAIFKRGFQLYEAGKFAEAVPIAEEYIRVAASTYGEEHPSMPLGSATWASYTKRSIARPKLSHSSSARWRSRKNLSGLNTQRWPMLCKRWQSSTESKVGCRRPNRSISGS